MRLNNSNNIYSGVPYFSHICGVNTLPADLLIFLPDLSRNISYLTCIGCGWPSISSQTQSFTLTESMMSLRCRACRSLSKPGNTEGRLRTCPGPQTRQSFCRASRCSVIQCQSVSQVSQFCTPHARSGTCTLLPPYRARLKAGCSYARRTMDGSRQTGLVSPRRALQCALIASRAGQQVSCAGRPCRLNKQ